MGQHDEIKLKHGCTVMMEISKIKVKEEKNV